GTLVRRVRRVELFERERGRAVVALGLGENPAPASGAVPRRDDERAERVERLLTVWAAEQLEAGRLPRRLKFGDCEHDGSRPEGEGEPGKRNPRPLLRRR